MGCVEAGPRVGEVVADGGVGESAKVVGARGAGGVVGEAMSWAGMVGEEATQAERKTHEIQ